jgi:hypothetical protein
MSKFHKNKKLSEDHKNKLISSIKGKKQSLEHINKRKMFGEKNPAYGKSGSFKGKNHTDETKNKLREYRKGMFTLGDNPRSKKVINTETKEIFNSAKEVSIIYKINYSTIKAMLQGRNPNTTKFIYYQPN